MSLLISSGLYGQEPVFRLRDMDNQWREYGELKGRNLTLIDFWATWCQPCVKSMPMLNEISEEYESQGVSFIGISIDGPRSQSKIVPFTQSMGISYPILKDMNSQLMSELGVSAVPTLLIYDAGGELVYFHEGFRPGDEGIIRKEIEKQLGH